MRWALQGQTLAGDALEIGGGSGAMAEQLLDLHPQLRVLKPRGTVIGYELLSTAPARALHLADGSTHRLMRFDELRALTAQLPVGQAILIPGLGGLVARFILRR